MKYVHLTASKARRFVSTIRFKTINDLNETVTNIDFVFSF